MTVIPFKSDAGKYRGTERAYCPGCGAARPIVARVKVETANEHFDYAAEGVTIECSICGNHQVVHAR